MTKEGQPRGDDPDTATETADTGFEGWAAAAASELAYFANLELAGDGQRGLDAEGGSLPPGAAVSFLLGEGVLGDSDAQGLPGYYERADDMRLAAQNMLYVLYGVAWRDLDGVDCDLRLYTDCDPEDDTGTVIALDATPRQSGAAGTVIFLLDPVSLYSFVCHCEEDLRALYNAVDAGRTPTLWR